jgi:hypothetical protein
VVKRFALFGTAKIPDTPYIRVNRLKGYSKKIYTFAPEA